MPGGRKLTFHLNEKSHALAISFSIFLLLAVGVISLSYWNAAESSHDAIAINLAGRQRMLTQRMEKNLLKLDHAKRKRTNIPPILRDLSDSHSLFDLTLVKLGQGRLAEQDGTSFRIASSGTTEYKLLIQQAYSLWLPMRNAMQPFISTPSPYSDAELAQALHIVMRDNQKLMILMDSITTKIENAAHIKSIRIRTIEAMAISLLLVNFGFILFYFRRQLNLLSESKLLSTRIMENAGTAIMLISRKCNIELCNRAAEELFKYGRGTLAGQNMRDLLEEPYFMQIGKRANGERFALDIQLNEISYKGHRVFIVSLFDLTEQKLREEELCHLAYHDPLTGLPNRLLFMDRLGQAIARAHRNNELSAILFIDLDRFKQVNDTLGHAIGDLLLQNVANRLMGCMREGETLIRLGGDEFTMIIDTKNTQNCMALAQRLLSELSREFDLDGHKVSISGSIGASIYPDDSLDINTLLHYADIAMYQAKSRGGNSCCKYSEIAALQTSK